MAAYEQGPFDLRQTESPQDLGRAVVALAADVKVARKSGGVRSTFRLAKGGLNDKRRASLDALIRMVVRLRPSTTYISIY